METPPTDGTAPVSLNGVGAGDCRSRAGHPMNLAMLAMISPQASAKLAGDYGTAVDHVLAMAIDDLRPALAAHEIALEEESADWRGKRVALNVGRIVRIFLSLPSRFQQHPTRQCSGKPYHARRLVSW